MIPWRAATEPEGCDLVPNSECLRVTQWLDIIGVDGRRVLELGPLEGGHSYMLQRAGAARVLAIEANTRAFLKFYAIRISATLQESGQLAFIIGLYESR